LQFTSENNLPRKYFFQNWNSDHPWEICVGLLSPTLSSVNINNSVLALRSLEGKVAPKAESSMLETFHSKG